MLASYHHKSLLHDVFFVNLLFVDTVTFVEIISWNRNNAGSMKHTFILSEALEWEFWKNQYGVWNESSIIQ